MNILDLNKNIYGCKSLNQGENIDLIIKSIEEQQMVNLNNKENNNIFKEIKF